MIMCRKTHRYRSSLAAGRVAKLLGWKLGVRFRIYVCPQCGLWCLTTKVRN